MVFGLGLQQVAEENAMLLWCAQLCSDGLHGCEIWSLVVWWRLPGQHAHC